MTQEELLIVVHRKMFFAGLLIGVLMGVIVGIVLLVVFGWLL